MIKEYYLDIKEYIASLKPEKKLFNRISQSDNETTHYFSFELFCKKNDTFMHFTDVMLVVDKTDLQKNKEGYKNKLNEELVKYLNLVKENLKETNNQDCLMYNGMLEVI